MTTVDEAREALLIQSGVTGAMLAAFEDAVRTDERLRCSGHILGMDCWCGPYRDGVDPDVVIHREEARS